jgi:peptidyl-prolyl cis-trans isomerase D
MFAFCFFRRPQFRYRERAAHVRFRPQAHPGDAAHAVPADLPFVRAVRPGRLQPLQEKGEAVAKVDGQDITQSQWDAEHKSEVDKLRQQMPTIDAKLLDSPAARYARWSAWCVTACSAPPRPRPAGGQRPAPGARTAVQRGHRRAARQGRQAGHGALQAAAGAQGMSPQQFEEQVRTDLGSRQVLAGVVGSGFGTPAQANVSLGSFFDKREVQVARFDPADYAAKVNPTPPTWRRSTRTTRSCSRRPSRRPSSTWCWTSRHGEEGHRRQRAGPQDLLRAERRPPGRPGRAPRQPHPGRRAQGRVGGRQGQGACARAGTAEAARKAPQSFADLAKKNSQDTVSAGQRRRPRLVGARRRQQGARGRGVLAEEGRGRSPVRSRPNSAGTW